MIVNRKITAAALGLMLVSSAAQAQVANDLNDYPTVTRADYIFGCMQVNGNTRLALERCSCSIDVIASILPHDAYVNAETILAVRQRGGEGVVPMNGPQAVETVKQMKSAQVEGELRCF
jgi:hypothetical protein